MFFNNSKFIIKCEPERINISDKQLLELAKKMEQQEGLTQEEIYMLLDWTVENTRRNIEKYTGIDIKDDELTGLCGFAQSSSLLPFEQIFKETYNSTVDFSYIIDDLRHAFGTITFPLKTKFGIEEKQYLIDVTLRQFYIKEMCEKPQYKMNGTFYMHPGYFMCNKNHSTKKSISLAQQLLKKGYIELTDENLKLYIQSFMYSSIYSTNQNYLSEIKKLNINYYKEQLKHAKPIDLEFDEEMLQRYGCITRFPYLEYKTKTLR